MILKKRPSRKKYTKHRIMLDGELITFYFSRSTNHFFERNSIFQGPTIESHRMLFIDTSDYSIVDPNIQEITEEEIKHTKRLCQH